MFDSLTLNQHWNRLYLPIGLSLLVFLVLLLARSIIFRYLIRHAKTEHPFYGAVRPMVYGPSLFWCVAIAIHIGMDISNLPDRQVKVFYQVIHVSLILSITWAVANLSAQLFRNVVRTSNHNRVSGLAVVLVKWIIFAIGFTASLGVMGIPVGPFLGALGVGGLAVALALKDTLENVFAGIYLITDRSIQVGDMIRVDNSLEGYVEDIGWRTVRIRSLMNNIVIIPNSKLSQSAITNLTLPDPALATVFTLAVASSEAPQKIESLLLEVIRKASEDLTGLLTYPEPKIRLTELSKDGTLTFSVKIFVTDYSVMGFVQHEVIKRIWDKLEAEKVEKGLVTTRSIAVQQ